MKQKYSCHFLLALCMVSIGTILTQNIQEQLEEVDALLTNINAQVESLEEDMKECRKNVTYFKEARADVKKLSGRCLMRVRGRNGSVPQIQEINSDFDKVDRSDDALDLVRGREHGRRLCLKVPTSVRRCLRSFEDTPITLRAAQINCLQAFLWEFKPVEGDPRSGEERLRSLVTLDQLHVPLAGNKVRKEYRTLTAVERTHYHNALNRMYRNGMIQAFGRIHARVKRIAHGGYGFLLWHRAFLALFEQALHQEDPTVSLPYWDSTIDFDLDNPVNSVLWTHTYFGSGTGAVTEGPFSGWVAHEGRLERQFGDPGSGRLISKADIAAILNPSLCRFGDMATDLELVHGGVHLWVGGDMRNVGSAAYDPVFYMHHCFVDYVWEKFRMHQATNSCNIDPTTDYPRGRKQTGHNLEDSMGGMTYFKIEDGLADWWTGGPRPWYRYEEPPTCPECGGAESIECETLGTRRRCVPKSTIATFVENAISERKEAEPPKRVTPLPLDVPTTSPIFVPTTSCIGKHCEDQPPAAAPPMAPLIVEDVVPQLDEVPVPAVLRNNIERSLNVVPRNREEDFLGPAPDGRNIRTALSDALHVKELKEDIVGIQELEDDASKLSERLKELADKISELQELETDPTKIIELKKLEDDVKKMIERLKELEDDAIKLAEPQGSEEDANKIAEQKKIEDDANKIAKRLKEIKNDINKIAVLK